MIVLGYSVILIVSFYLIARVSDRYFVKSLDKISTRLGLSHDMAGATFMAVGSSAPEFFVALIAITQPGNHQNLGAGTIVGSAIFNMLAIIGATAIVRKATLAWQPIIRDLLFYGVAVVLLWWTFGDGRVSMLEAGIFVGLYLIYLVAVFYWRKILPFEDIQEKQLITGSYKVLKEKDHWPGKVLRTVDYFMDKVFPRPKFYYFVFFVSIIAIAALSWVLVESAIVISEELGIPEVVIALTVLAMGTSIPDLVSSIIVAKQGRAGMAVSNAVGSNVFDILIGLGFPWLIYMAYTGETIAVETTGLSASIILLFGSVVVIFGVLAFNRWKIGKITGVIFLGLYILYVISEVIKANM